MKTSCRDCPIGGAGSIASADEHGTGSGQGRADGGAVVGPTAVVIYTGGLITPVGRIELRVPRTVRGDSQPQCLRAINAVRRCW